MTDREIIKRLIDHDERVTRWFFYEKCRPLFLAIIRYTFNYPVSYDEFVNELYLLLMDEDARRLRQFDFRSSLCQWIKTVALRHFVRKHSLMIEDETKDSLLNRAKRQTVINASKDSHLDFTLLLTRMKNRRQAIVLQRLVVDEAEPKVVAAEIGVTVDNLYNIKKRAITALTQIALTEI